MEYFRVQILNDDQIYYSLTMCISLILLPFLTTGTAVRFAAQQQHAYAEQAAGAAGHHTGMLSHAPAVLPGARGRRQDLHRRRGRHRAHVLRWVSQIESCKTCWSDYSNLSITMNSDPRLLPLFLSRHFATILDKYKRDSDTVVTYFPVTYHYRHFHHRTDAQRCGSRSSSTGYGRPTPTRRKCLRTWSQ